MREWGRSDGRPLVFWHGLNAFGPLQLNEAGPAWARRGFHVLAPVAPGFGESPPFLDLGDYRLTRLADLVANVADELRLSRFVFVGWSWGASIGVHLAARHAVRLSSLVLLDAGHTDLQDDLGWRDATLDERVSGAEAQVPVYATWDEALAAARERGGAWRPALEERIRAGLVERGGAIVPRADTTAMAAAFHWVGVERPSEQLQRLGALHLPLLLVVATRNDTTAQVERFRASVPHAEIRTVDSGHDVFAHAPEETERIVAEWVLGSQPSVA